jgi:DNA-directed RNA polymerase specialized sigma24 family protein
MIQSSEDTQSRDDGLLAEEQTGAAANPDRMDDHGRAYFAALFQKYRSSLFRYLTGLVTSPDDAAELVQESYARLLQHEDVTQLEAVSRTYLFQIATNLARDHYRRRATRHSGAHLDVDAIEITDERAGPEHNLVWDSTIESIKEGTRTCRR